MQGRGFTPVVVENAIAHGALQTGQSESVCYDPENNLSVVVDNDSGGIITVSYGRLKAR